MLWSRPERAASPIVRDARSSGCWVRAALCSERAPIRTSAVAHGFERGALLHRQSPVGEVSSAARPATP